MQGEGATRVRIAVGGAAEAADRWARSLRGVEGTDIVTIAGLSPATLAETFAEAPCAALVIASPERELPATVRAAALAGCDVLVAGTPALTSATYASLAELARRRGRIIAFHSEQIDDERARFVRRMTRGPQAPWRVSYLRALRTGDDLSVDEAAIEQIALVSSLLGRDAERVSAVSPSTDESSLDAALLTITYADGVVGRIDISALDAEPRREAVLVCDGRTVTLDALDRRAPLRITAAARHRGPQAGAGWSEVVSEFPPAEHADSVTVAAERFVNAVRARDREATNAGLFASASSVWEAARRSIADGGEMQDLTPQQTAAERPALRLIAGGGRGSETAPAPQLRLIRGEPVPMRRSNDEPAGTPA
jgi:predicted dehydrogenase